VPVRSKSLHRLQSRRGALAALARYGPDARVAAMQEGRLAALDREILAASPGLNPVEVRRRSLLLRHARMLELSERSAAVREQRRRLVGAP
jgi:hypothetical protein